MIMKIIRYETAKYWNYVFKNIGKHSALNGRIKTCASPYTATGHSDNNDTADNLKYERFCKEIAYTKNMRLISFDET